MRWAYGKIISIVADKKTLVEAKLLRDVILQILTSQSSVADQSSEPETGLSMRPITQLL